MNQELLDSIKKTTSQEEIGTIVDNYLRTASSDSDQILYSVDSVMSALKGAQTQLQYIQNDLKHVEIVNVLNLINSAGAELTQLIQQEQYERQMEDEKVREELK